MSRSDNLVDVVRAWRDMELFSPQTVKKAFPGAAQPSTDWEVGQCLPWEQGSYLQTRPIPETKVWRHTVYLWIYGLRDMYACLDRIYRPDEEALDERMDGQSAVVSFAVDADGRLETDSIVLSAAAWGLGRCYRDAQRQESWFDEFTSAAQGFTEGVIDSCGKSAEDPAITGLRVDTDILLGIGALARAVTRLPDDVLRPGRTVARIESHAIRRDTDPVGGDFLNSFILDDLGRVADAVAHNQSSPPLTAYLRSATGASAPTRTDTVATPAAAATRLGPGDLPYGRWPNYPNQHLAFSQQLAVNLSLADLAQGSGLRSVNGPPGTGKTTLLRDVVAGLVVERARQIAALTYPNDAFAGKVQWKTRDYDRTVYVLRPELTGFEMVVASANNKAVQSVSDELPDIATVKKPWQSASYLREIATEVRRATNEDDDAEAWGLISARLGNKDNRRRFAKAFWTHGRDWAQGPTTFRRFLEEAKVLSRTPWPQATRTFHQALQRVDELTERAGAAEGRLARQAQLNHERTRAEATLARLQAHEQDAATCWAKRNAELEAAADNVGVIRGRYDDHDRRRPGFWTTLMTFGSALREWSAAERPLAQTLSAAYELHDRARAACDAAAAGLAAVQRDVAGAQHTRMAIHREQIALTPLLSADRRHFGDAYPDAEWMADETRRELAAPWVDEALNSARSQAFLAALDLHTVWFSHCAQKLISSMRGAMDVACGDAPRDLDADKAQAAWQVFFLVVPLVSTTFDSLARMFSHLDGQSLGWLFVDEAGQARPQAAVGALWRCRHAVVVGDPQQLTPIVPLPTKAEAAIAGEHGVPRSALPSRTSVQVIADAINPWGTYLGTGDDRLWVGTPLRVHRRCDDPMFTISNQVAYGGLMIHGTARSREQQLGLPPSAWLDVPAEPGAGHALREDLQIAERVVSDLLNGSAGGPKVSAEEIIVISPFRAMADALRELPDRLDSQLRAGTVHTVQGQEADVVVFLLGGDPNRPGARSWAAATPNLVNVAASRAKQRLYVIGDHAAWSRHNYFSTVADFLPRRIVGHHGI